jgi:prophage regulatory protein
MTNGKKAARVRARAMLISEDFGLVKAVQDKVDSGASIHSIVSTAYDMVEQARDEGGDRILRIREVVEMVGVSKQAVYGRMRRGTFPKRFSLGGTGKTARVGWLHSEVRAWLRERAAER